MSFRDNLQHLRATRSMTQEQLAMLVGVSRQSVTKWEAEKAYPEMDKLLQICQIFDCTLDELVQGDLTSRESSPAFELSSNMPQDVCGYDEHMRAFSRNIALGVFSIIFGVGLGLVLDLSFGPRLGIEEGGITTAVLFVGLIIGLILIIPAGVGHGTFKKQHPYILDFYTAEDKTRSSRTGGYGIAIGCALIFVGIILVSLLQSDIAAGFMLLLIAAGVGAIVYSGIMMSRTDISAYNDDALAELSDDEAEAILSTLDEKEAASRIAKRRVNKKIGAICGIIMLAATAIALLILFAGDALGGFGERAVDYFWVSWPIGGICCGIVGVASSLMSGKK